MKQRLLKQSGYLVHLCHALLCVVSCVTFVCSVGLAGSDKGTQIAGNSMSENICRNTDALILSVT